MKTWDKVNKQFEGSGVQGAPNESTPRCSPLYQYDDVALRQHADLRATCAASESRLSEKGCK